MFAAELLISSDINEHIYNDINIEQLSSIICIPTKLIKYQIIYYL